MLALRCTPPTRAAFSAIDRPPSVLVLRWWCSWHKLLKLLRASVPPARRRMMWSQLSPRPPLLERGRTFPPVVQLRQARYRTSGEWIVPDIREVVFDRAWTERAACIGEEELFGAEGVGPTQRLEASSATQLLKLLICAGCPVRVQCLRSALDPPALSPNSPAREWGIWGGTDDWERGQTRDLPLEERAALLEREFPDRLRVRIEAWHEALHQRDGDEQAGPPGRRDPRRGATAAEGREAQAQARGRTFPPRRTPRSGSRSQGPDRGRRRRARLLEGHGVAPAAYVPRKSDVTSAHALLRWKRLASGRLESSLLIQDRPGTGLHQVAARSPGKDHVGPERERRRGSAPGAPHPGGRAS